MLSVLGNSPGVITEAEPADEEKGQTPFPRTGSPHPTPPVPHGDHLRVFSMSSTKLSAALLELVLPERCPACHRAGPPGLCRQCAPRAGDLLLADSGFVVLAPGVVAVGAFAHADPVAEAVRSVKRPGRHGPARALGRLLWQVIDANVGIGGLPRTWVPSSPRALRTRGVEIPRLLAGDEAMSLLTRPENRPDQTSLDASGRRGNVAGAFVATGPAPETVVCVDDVRTTGSTLRAAGAALRAAGARRVVGVTLTVAGHDAV